MQTRDAWRTVLAAASIGAAAVHLAAVPAHDGDPLLAGTLGVAAVAQVAWGLVALLRRDRRLLLVGAALQASVLAAYAASRTTGLPFGSHPWQPEAVGRADLLCCLLEAGVLVGCLALAARPAALCRRVRARAATLAAGALVGVAATTGAALAAPAHGHGHPAVTRTADDPRTEAVETGVDANANGVDDGVEEHFRAELLDAHGGPGATSSGATPEGADAGQRGTHHAGTGHDGPSHHDGAGHHDGTGHHAGAHAR